MGLLNRRAPTTLDDAERRASIVSTAPPARADVVRNEHAKKVDTGALTGASSLSVRQSLVPLTLVTILFFLWGFAYGLLDTLNAKFQDTLGVSAAQAAGLQAAYFGAYFVAPLTFAGWLVRHVGYRWTFITGLVIYGIGSLMFWPSAVYLSFGGFCGSMFIVGSGLSTLETSANPYISTCGPPRLSEFRLEMSQSVQAVGSVVAPLLAARVFFNNVQLSPGQHADLSNVQWTYLGIAGFVFCLAVVFFFAPIPEVTDADMALQADQTHSLTDHVQKPLKRQYKLFFGVAAQFCYVGGQVAVASIFIKYAVESAGISSSAASDRYAIGQGVFAIGRFLAAGGMLYIRPRIILWVFATGAVIFGIASCAVWGEGGIAVLTIVLLFESCMFPVCKLPILVAMLVQLTRVPTILTLSIRGLGKHTKRGGSFVVAATSGGAFFPAMTGLAADRWNFHVSMFVPVIGFVVSWAFSAAVNTRKDWTKQLDGFRKSRIGYKGGENAAEDEVKSEDGERASEGVFSGDEKRGHAETRVEV